MPPIGPPSGVGGKDTGLLTQDHDGSAPGGTGPTPDPGRLALFAENRERQARNSLRNVRRKGGEVDVSDDESLHMLDGSDDAELQPEEGDDAPGEPSAPATSGPSRPKTPEQDSRALLAEVMKMTPKGRGIALEMWKAGAGRGIGAREDKSSESEAKGTLISEASEKQADLFESRLVDAHPQLIALLANGFHLPLSMCTTSSIREMHKHPEKIRYRKMHDGQGSKRELIDITAWRAEDSLQPEEWRDAWRNYMEILPQVCEPAITKRLLEHFLWLCELDELNTMFAVILEFDIDVRRGYWLSKKKFTVASPSYQAHFLKVRLQHLERRSPVVSHTSTPHTPFTPYTPSGASASNSRRGRSEGVTDTPAKPFREGKAPNPAGVLCLICSESGHRASSCGRTTFPSGKPTFSVWSDKKLVAMSSRAELSDTGARSVVPTVMPLHLSGASERDRVITPYNADTFESTLLALGPLDRYPMLPRKLRYGFPIGNFDTLSRTVSPANHASGSEHIDFIRQYIAEQVSLGRMTGPYSRPNVERILGSFFMSSPLAVVPKAGSKKFRLVQNCSYQDEFGISVNSYINSDDFPTKWGTAAEVAEIIVNAPAGAQAACLDIDSAFRNLPIHPAHKPFLVIQCDPGDFYIDHVLPFGVSSGTGVQGEPMDAIVDILEAHGIGPSRKWVDDLINFRFPIRTDPASGAHEYAYSLPDIFRITDPLGVPWHQTKWSDYATRATYSGFLWDLAARKVSLPPEKRDKYLAKLTTFIAAIEKGRVSQRDAMSINGTLSHITFVYPHGRAFLTSLCNFIASFHNPYAPRYAPHSVLSDMKWWLSILSIPDVCRSLSSRGPLQDLGIWVDASSSWGVGIIIAGEWSSWRWCGEPGVWKCNGRDIGWAEMVAVELAVRTIECLGQQNAHILIRGDNKGVEGAFARGRSRNFQVNSSIRRTEVIAMALNILFTVQYVNTKDNLADPMSLHPSLLLSDMPRIISAPARASAPSQCGGSSSAEAAADTGPSSRMLTRRKPRQPRSGNQITPSLFRPHVLARDRLALWSTPHAVRFRSALATKLSYAATIQLFDVMLSSLDASTRKNYGAGLLRFTQFCDCLGISEDLRMPAPEALVAAFVAQWSGRIARSTVDTWMAGLAFWHALHGAPWSGGKMLRVTCSAISKTAPAAKEKRAPVTIEHLYALRSHLDLSNSFDAAVYAVACVAFWCCRRLGELVIPSAGTFDPSKHIARSAPITYRTLPGGIEYAVFHVPWTKTTKQLGADIIATELGDPSSAVIALRHHQQANAKVPAHAPLFSFETTDSTGWAPMTRDWFLNRCNQVWSTAGFEHLTGHCFRIGGATELLLRGTHPDVVATQGSWKSRAFLEYWRKIESILPLFISQSFSSSRMQLATEAMDSFKKKHSL
ncbi:hypothetical protein SCP_0905260 [Sparassis crispa]|uniref:Uncharacterized protein n=1 Tax=Sparassis crispa TaxID=139825 RepID=A0A401GWP2_9APHY|nr:hypothetical protein SCP_0905260 [Sparassis crispa]GBE86646.1 hypothetical protein SCP_0905260 [Sparassis crispa]